MSIPNQTIGKLSHYNDPDLDKEFAQIYDFIQHAKYPDDSIDGRSLKFGSVPDTRLIPPISAAVSPGTPATPHRTDAEINALADARINSLVPFRFESYASCRDEKPNGTPGGTFTSAIWQTRDINTIVEDDDSIISIAANQITIVPGTFYTRIKCPSLRVQSNVARFVDILDLNTPILDGTNEFSSPASFGSNSSSVIRGFFTIAVSTTFEIHHQCYLTRATHGFGGSVLTFDAPIPPEVYTTAEFWKVGE